IIHTNLGRSPWPPRAIEAAAKVAQGYCNLEMELESGERGGRLSSVSSLMQFLVGADDAIVVNNGAAAVLLALTALARDREVIVSRGELVEIGGSFRVPDVIASGGALLREVGTTNRTRVADYASAIGPETSVLLRVHSSNFRLIGYTESAPIAALAQLAHEHQLLLLDDQGSGSLEQMLPGTPSIRQALHGGVDVVLFSGDKLLGGPQAGFAVGKRDVIQRLRRHPMYRALRVDKTILAGIEATLISHVLTEQTPVAEMMERPLSQLEQKGQQLVTALGHVGIKAEALSSLCYVGGGSLPEEAVPSIAVVVRAEQGLDSIATALRLGAPAIVPRVHGGALMLDIRTMGEFDIGLIANRVASVWCKG
ncbi:MAG: L-seryl-tRNA(Sec) selenium transferase, partial [Proteobacteria bacterium]|nr:L-seryl-tRNA(Sec) selenium transferase [Pseudomonadota bacterium]